IDLHIQLQEIYCSNGGVSISGNLCNQGANQLPGSISVALYSSNPLLSQPEIQSVHLLNTSASDTCFNFLINGLSPEYLNHPAIYAIVNDNGTTIPPYINSSFPLGNIQECNYLNNLDSFDVNSPAQQIPDLGLDQISCQDTAIILTPGSSFFHYAWQDGSTNATLTVDQSGYYWVQTIDICGFKHRDTVQISFDILPDTSFSDFSICPGYSINLGLPGLNSYLWSPPAGLDCNTCPLVNIQPTISTTYTLDAISALGCLFKDTFTVQVLTLPTRTESISFCPGASVSINGQVYDQAGTIIDTLPAIDLGCDTIATYNLTLLPQPAYTKIIEFCKGEQVVINNQIFTEPGITTFSIPSLTGGCDTSATYVIEYLTPDEPVQLSIACPDNISVEAAPGATSVTINFDEASASSDCPCPGLKLWQSSGMASGSAFPIGTTQVCFSAMDSCNNLNTCCFNVSIQAAPEACDVKTIGCVKFELLGISLDGELDRRYNIRVTNNCSNKMIYTAFQIPDGLPALYPSDNSIFTAPSGRTYLVRNPNFSPSYSIRFKSVSDSIANGAYEVFNYQIPAQSAPDYIHAMIRLEPQNYYEVHLNTFYCPITHEGQVQRSKPGNFNEVVLFPNPTDGVLWIDHSSLESTLTNLSVFDTRGNLILRQQSNFYPKIQTVALPQHLPDGIYFLQIQTENGENRMMRFVVQR
ncbi:MAG TPA: T9SS type A sorting domain-containing protein, partial [Saprospiraceae bacterium]|nr:T9SS type A sorting domain-containing protein [Saprospiraceae bacterium]